jgi:peptide/nickel transport system permease protein
MIGFLLHRLAWAVPTLLLIILIGFSLSVNTPGDPVLSRLKSMEGQSSDPSSGLVNFESQYIRLRQQMGLDKPMFYFSLIPAHYPDTLHRIHLLEQRRACVSLLEAGIPWTNIDQFRKDVFQLKNTFLGSITDSTRVQKNQTIAVFNNLLSAQQVEHILTIWTSWNKSQVTANSKGFEHPISQVDKAILELNTQQNQWRTLIPSLAWHGLGNQYHHWLSGILRLDFGQSFQDGKDVIDLIIPSLKWTFWLNGSALLLTLLLGIPLGVWLASLYRSWVDRLITAVLFSSYALPSYWIATLMIIFLCSGTFLSLFPVGGVESLMHDSSWPLYERVFDWALHLALPVIALTYFNLSLIALQVRNDTKLALEALHIRTAFAKGLAQSTVLWKHAFLNSILPLIALVGQLIPSMVSGSVFIESIFSIPGSGTLLYQAVLSRDYPVIIGVFTCVGTLTILALLLVDMLQYWFNPLLREKPSA